MLRCCASMSPKALFNNWQGFRADTGPVMHSGWPDPDRVLRKKWKGIEMMNIKSLYEISEITVWRKGMIVFSWRSPSSPSSELSGKNGEDKVTGKRDGVIRELKPRRQQISKILPLQAQSTFSVECTFVYPRHSKSNVRKSNSIELNRIQSVDWVRLSSAIERNRTPHFQWVRFPNKSNSIELNPSDCVRLSSETELNRTQLNGFRSRDYRMTLLSLIVLRVKM